MQRRRQWHYCCNYNSTMTTMALMRWCRLFHGRRINHINGCNARRAINIQWGWGVYFNDIPNIWTRRPTHDGIIVILGRALVVYLRTVCCCWWVQLPIIIMWMISFKSKACNDRLTMPRIPVWKFRDPPPTFCELRPIENLGKAVTYLPSYRSPWPPTLP